jgi:hypothetical protein
MRKYKNWQKKCIRKDNCKAKSYLSSITEGQIIYPMA